MTAPHLLDRRRFLRGSLAVGGGVVAASLPSGVWARQAAADDDHVRVYVLVVDGLRPDQVSRMPTVAQLAAEGTYLPESRAQMVAETTPNHISMLTGMRVDRHGMPGNAVPGLEDRVSDDRRYLQADTLFTLAARQAPELVTAAATSKDYIVETSKADRTGDGAEDATATNDPLLSIPGSDAAPDTEVGASALRFSRELDPDFLFVNLGDVDRVGHIDLTGGVLDRVAPDGTQPALQLAALTNADLQIRLLVEELRRSGRWEHTVLIVTADHSMDWSFLDRQLDLAPAFDADELLAGEVVTAVNGGACLYALRAPDEPRAGERLRRMREIALATDGVRQALYIRPNPDDGGDAHTVARHHPDWGLTGDRTGDLIVTVEPGYRIGHGGPVSNPIPGNHGHEATLPIPMVVAGGWDGIVRDTVVPDGPTGPTDRPADQGENIDIAPTVAWLLGLHPPPGGFDGRVLTEAFSRRPSPRVEVDNVASLPLFDELGPDGPVEAAVAASQEAFDDAAAHPFPGSLPLLTGDEQLADRIVAGIGTGGGEPTVVLGPVDAPELLVAAGPLGAALGAPLLLTGATLPRIVADEVVRLGARRALLLGSTDLLPVAVEEALEELGVATVDRLDGDPVEVAAAAAREIGVPDDSREVLLVGSATDAAHAQLVAQRRARPVLLGPGLPDPVVAVLDELDIDRVVAVGNVLDAADAERLRAEGRLVEPVTARDGLDLARRLAERAVREGALTDDLYVTADPAVTLAIAPAVGRLGGSLLLSDASVPSFVTDRADQLVRVRTVSAVPARTRTGIEDAIVERRTRAVSDPQPDQDRDTPPDRGEGRREGPDRERPGRESPGRDRRPTGPVGEPAGASRPLPVTGGGPGLLGLGVLGLAAALRRRVRAEEARTEVATDAEGDTGPS